MQPIKYIKLHIGLIVDEVNGLNDQDTTGGCHPLIHVYYERTGSLYGTVVANTNLRFQIACVRSKINTKPLQEMAHQSRFVGKARIHKIIGGRDGVIFNLKLATSINKNQVNNRINNQAEVLTLS